MKREHPERSRVYERLRKGHWNITQCLQVLPNPPLSIGNPMEVVKLLRSRAELVCRVTIVSLDVVGMYPNIPEKEAATVAEEGWLAHPGCPEGISELSGSQLAHLIRSPTPTPTSPSTGTEPEGRPTSTDRRGGWRWGEHSLLPWPRSGWGDGRWESDFFELAERAGGRAHFAVRYMDDYFIGWEGSVESFERGDSSGRPSRPSLL